MLEKVNSIDTEAIISRIEAALRISQSKLFPTDAGEILFSDSKWVEKRVEHHRQTKDFSTSDIEARKDFIRHIFREEVVRTIVLWMNDQAKGMEGIKRADEGWPSTLLYNIAGRLSLDVFRAPTG